MTTRIKICGVTTVKQAQEIVALGADYIGLVFHPASKRNISIDSAVKISEAVKGQVTVVPVCVDQSAVEIAILAKELQTTVVQLHGREAVVAYADLCSEFTCIVALPCCDDVSLLTPINTFLLYDNQLPGSGTLADYTSMQINKDFRSFIAGGLSPENVKAVISQYQPYAVDVSTGVESAPGVKDLAKVKMFINAVRGGHD